MPFVDKALRILTEVGNNETNLYLLNSCLDCIVPFVGAGLSVEFGYPTWNNFLTQAADHFGLQSSVAPLLAVKQFEEAAEVIAKDYAHAFDDFLRESFDRKKLVRPLRKHAVCRLASIARGPVLTTNLDRVLEVAFQDAGRGFEEIFRGSQIREASRAIQLNEPFLLKLHGDYRDSTNRVILLSEYAREYGGTEPGHVNVDLPLPCVLSQALGARPLLFLGCSLQGDRTTRVISQIGNKLAGTVHFAVLSESENRPERLQELDGWNIRPIFFPHGHFEKISQLLDCIAEVTYSTTQRPIAQSQIVPADPVQHAPLLASCISILLPRTGPYLFGRDKDLRCLDKAWKDQNTNIVVLVAFGGVGKSTLLTHWLHAMRKINYGGAQRVYARSFYRQSSGDRTLSADVFIGDALSWFGDSDPKAGYPGEKGERLARLLKTQRTLLILDGLEVVQFPPGFQEGKLKDEGLRVLLRELAASNPGLCVISTRLSVADLRDFENNTVRCIKLRNLSSKAGAQFLRVLGVKGRPERLEQVAQAFGGHSLALSLLGNYLRKARHGDVERVNEISLSEADAAQGGHAFRVMESYATWLEAPEQAVLRMIGLFDHAADPTSISVLRHKPFISGLEETSEQLRDADWQIKLSNLRDAALLADSPPDQPEDLEAHPLVRDFFGAQFRRLYPEGWREAHRRLYEHLKTRAKYQPETSAEMAPLFAAVAHGCKAGLHEQVLEEVYKHRLMRGEARYASSKLAAFGPLLSALSNFFESGNWAQPVPALSANARMYVLNQAASYLSITKGFPAPEAKLAYEWAKREAEAADSVPDLFVAVRGLWRCHHVAAEYEDAWRAAHQLVDWSVKTAQPIHVAEAYFATGATAYYLGKLSTARRNLERAIAAYGPAEPHSGMGGFDVRVASLSYLAWTLWYLGFPETATKCCNEALVRARSLSDQHTLALALHFSAYLAHCCGNCDGVRNYARELSELSGRYGFVHWLACGAIMQGCASVMQRQFDDGINQIREGLEIWKSASAKLGLPNFTGKLLHAYGKAYEYERDKPNLLAKAFALVDDALTTSANHKERYYKPDLYRIKGELTILNAPRNLKEPRNSLDAEKLFQKAIELAHRERSKSLELRAVNSLSHLFILTQRKNEAREMLLRILESFSEGHDSADHVLAKSLLDRISHGESDLTPLPSTL